MCDTKFKTDSELKEKLVSNILIPKHLTPSLCKFFEEKEGRMEKMRR